MFSRSELSTEFDVDDDSLEGSVALGLVVPRDDGYVVPSARVLYAARELRAAGLPVESLLTEGAQLFTDLARIAQRWVALFLDEVWAPYVAAGMPPDDLPRITESLRRLPPLALATIEPLFARIMENAVAEAAAEALAIAPTVTSE